MRMVLLLHELPDGSSHFDWMIEREPEGKAGLITFRVSVRIDRMEQGRFEAVRLADHREAYLSLEGEVSGGRGKVSRVATGEASCVREGVSEMNVEGTLGVSGVWRGRGSGDAWVFEFDPG